MEYLYGSLNKLVELLKYKFVSSDSTVSLNLDNATNTLDISVNTQQLVTIKRLEDDPSNPGIIYYRLFAYNSVSKDFDIPLGDTIATGTATSNIPALQESWVKVGEYQKMEPRLDSEGNPLFDLETGILLMDPVFDADGNPVMVPIYHKVEASIGSNGLLVLENIPVSALTDSITDKQTQTITYIESIIDGNFGGKVY